MSAIKRHLELHEDNACPDPECRIWAEYQDGLDDGGTCQDEDSRFAPPYPREQVQAELQARLNALQTEPSQAERSADHDLNVLYEAARLAHFSDSILARFEATYPGSYNLLRDAIYRHEGEALDEDEARRDYEREELGA